jgi:uncharacterized membrane protein required for colicin V production
MAVCVVLLFTWAGCQKGFAAQVAPVLTLAVFGGILFYAYPHIFSYFEDLFYKISDAYVMWGILAVVAILMAGLFIVSNKLFAKILKAQVTDRTDKVYGFILGLIRGTLFTLLGLILIVMIGPRDYHEQLTEKSHVGRLVCQRLVPRIQPHMTSPEVEKRIDQLRSKLLEQDDAAAGIDK